MVRAATAPLGTQADVSSQQPLQSAEVGVAHVANHQPPQLEQVEATKQPAQTEDPGEAYAASQPLEPGEAEETEVEVCRIVRHICPDCEKAFATLEEAKAHWLEAHRPQEEQPEPQQSSAPAGPDEEGVQGSGVTADTGLARAQLIEADENGRPVIVRHSDPETGAERTIVMNEDGTMRMFGAETVASMTTRDESDIAEWIAVMTDRHLRGLVNEVRERLVESSHRLHDRRAELERLSKQLNFRYFGLSEGAKEKDLDNAYRRLARSMHPDKNGGTEEAKQRFQAMRGRYEELRSQLAAPPAAPERPEPARRPQEGGEGAESQDCSKEADSSDSASNQEALAKDAEEKQSGEECPEELTEEELERQRQDKEPEAQLRREANDEDNDAQPEAAAAGSRQGTTAGSHSSQASSRAGLEESAWKMLRQLKMVNQNLKIVESDFTRVQVDNSNAE